jgi:hypothetical protein
VSTSAVVVEPARPRYERSTTVRGKGYWSPCTIFSLPRTLLIGPQLHGRRSDAQAQLELHELAAAGRYVRDVY